MHVYKQQQQQQQQQHVSMSGCIPAYIRFMICIRN